MKEEQRNLEEIRTILEAAQEAITKGAQFQLRPQQTQGGVSPSGLKYKVIP